MAPEQFEGIADIRSDIYSFGIVLFQMINQGKLPFVCRTIEDFILAHKNRPIPKFESELALIIEKCLQKLPKDRYQDFKELRLDLEQCYKKNIGENIPLVPKEEINEAIEYASRGYSFNQLRLYDKAIEEFQKALKLNEDEMSVYNNLGISYIRKGLYDKSIDILKAGIKKFPKEANQYMTLADAYQYKRLSSKARKEIKKAMKLDPNNAAFHLLAGFIYADMKDLPEAIKSMRRSVELDSNNAFAYEHLGILLRIVGNLESITMFQKAIEINPASHKSYFYIGMHLYEQDRYKEALMFAKQALVINPNRAKYHVLVGSCHQVLGSIELAIKEYKEALRLEPNRNDAKTNLEKLLRGKF